MTAQKQVGVWEMIIVDDGSTDHSEEVANEFANSHGNIKAYHHSRNLGVGGAMRTGFENSTGDYVTTLDVDLSYPVDRVDRRLLKTFETKAKFIDTSPHTKGEEKLIVIGSENT